MIAPYRSTAVFDETTLPHALRREHRTKAGVWGVIRVLEGRLKLELVDSGDGTDVVGVIVGVERRRGWAVAVARGLVVEKHGSVGLDVRLGCRPARHAAIGFEVEERSQAHIAIVADGVGYAAWIGEVAGQHIADCSFGGYARVEADSRQRIGE